MRVVIQRVSEAAVKGPFFGRWIFFMQFLFILILHAKKSIVGDECCGRIARGLCLLVGITHDDVDADLDYWCVPQEFNH